MKIFKEKKKEQIKFADVQELTIEEADAIIATGGNVMNMEYYKEHEQEKHRQLQSLLNKLHGK